MNAAPSVTSDATATAAAAGNTALSVYTGAGTKRKPQQGGGGSGSGGGAAGDLMLYNNPTKDVMYQPVQGPQEATTDLVRRGGGRKHGNQDAMETNVAFDETAFAEQRHAFQRTGQALAPTADGGPQQHVYRTTLGYSAARLQTFAAREQVLTKRPRRSTKAAAGTQLP